MNKVEIYVDGGSRGNGTPGCAAGYGVFLKYGEHTKEIYEGFIGKTNNQMEIKAAIEGLKAMKKFNIPTEVYTDSAYVCNCINNKWYKKWLDNGWVTSTKKPVENRELWIELIDLIEKFAFLRFVKVKGHSGIFGNERADALANKAMDSIS